ncbi:DUF559 domain-containing protein [Nocardia sp. NPDC050406]|uniref:DUF559 domain-containing protein n=1 Tax=Nocardia sp. NPDC050406 TaxID=3364318 RepID=UPI0037BE06AD
MTHGIRTRDELIATGISPSTIDYRCRQGLYLRILPRTYCLGPVTGLARCHAIVAWLPEATLSHRTAAWLRNMLPEPTVFEATIPAGAHRKTPEWLTLYRRDLPQRDYDDAWGLPVTSPARTLMDCLAVLPTARGDELVDGHLGRTVPFAEVRELCRTGGTGSPALRRQVSCAATRALSEPERLFARALTRRRLDMLANHPVGPYVCDFVHERTRTIVEIDGREFHSAAEPFRRDRRRQNWLQTRGWFVLRYAAADVYEYLDRCADEVVAVVRRRRT